MNLLNSLRSSGPPREGEGKMKRGEIKSDREEIKDLKAIDFLLSHCGCLFFGDCGASKGLRWVFSGSQDAAPVEHGTLTVRPRTYGEYQQKHHFFRIQIRTFCLLAQTNGKIKMAAAIDQTIAEKQMSVCSLPRERKALSWPVVVSLLRVLTGPSTPILKKTRFRAGPRRDRALERG